MNVIMNLAGGTVHIIDDDDFPWKALARVIASHGIKVVGYESGRAFLTAPPTHGPGCILLDMHIPQLSGLELQQFLVGQQNPLPIVFISGEVYVDTTVEAVKAGAVDFVTKPIASAREALNN